MAKPMVQIRLEQARSPDAVQPQQRVADLAERLARTLGIARALAQGGRRLDLAGFEDGVGLLCAQTLDLPPAEGRALLPLLTNVLVHVEILTAVLRMPPGQEGGSC
jgi:hypothetical protein